MSIHFENGENITSDMKGFYHCSKFLESLYNTMYLLGLEMAADCM